MDSYIATVNKDSLLWIATLTSADVGLLIVWLLVAGESTPAFLPGFSFFPFFGLHKIKHGNIHDYTLSKTAPNPCTVEHLQ